MAVQTGEGTTEIIYGSTSIPGGPRVYGGYLARPDGRGEWPTVLVFGPNERATSSVKHICRSLARYGIAALAPDLDHEDLSYRQVAAAITGFITDPGGDWSNAQFGFGVLAFEGGMAAASGLAAVDGRVVAHASIGSNLGEDVVADLAEADVPGLFVGSRGDEAVDIDAAVDVRSEIPQTTYVIYPEGDTGYWSDTSDGFEQGHFDDILERLVEFLTAQLPPRV